MKLASAISLGAGVNLLHGLRPDWDFGQKASPFFPLDAKPLRESDVEVTPAAVEWGYPDISLHESAEDLLSAVLPFDVAHASDDTAAPVVRSGFLLIADKDRPAALVSLSNTLGVDLTKPGQCYALVEIRREVATAWHAGYRNGVFIIPNPATPDPAVGVDEEFRRRMTQLRPDPLDDGGTGARSPFERVKGCLSLFRTYGTHFVSRVQCGERLFQVFAYAPEAFKAVRAAYASGENPLSGRRAVSFSYYTTPATPGGTGYVSQHGRILSASGDPALAASLAAGQWKEPTFAKTASLFAIYEPDTAMSLDTLDRTFTQVAPIRTELYPLVVFAESARRPAWRRVFKAAMYQKYLSGIQPNFVKTDQRDYQSLIPMEDTGLVSSIATPTINAYKERLDLAGVEIVAADQVKDFTLFANCLQHSGGAPVAVPGASVALAAHIMAMDPRQPGAACVIQVEDAAFDSLQLTCQEFHGALLVTNRSASKHFVVVDGLRFASQDGSAGRWEVAVVADVRIPPPPGLAARIKDSLEFSMVFAEAIVSDQGADPGSAIQSLAVSYFKWVADLVAGDTTDADLLDLRLRALDLGKSAAEAVTGVFVPILPYADYEKNVTSVLSLVSTVNAEISEHQQAIARRKSDELVIDVGKTLNQNIIQSGQLLSGVVSASAQQMTSMSEFYDSVVETTREEYRQQDAKIGELERLLVDAKASVGTAVEGYKSAVQAWQQIEWVKFGLNLAADLFKGGASIAGGDGGEILKSLADLAKQAQGAYEIVDKTNALYGRVDKSEKLVKEAIDSLAQADPVSSNPSLLAWDEIPVRFAAVMKAGPEDIAKSAREAVEGAFAILVLRGKATVLAKANARRLAREVYLNQRKKQLNTDQAARLNALNGALKPAQVGDLDRSKIDLIGLTGKLLFVRKQMLAMLAKSFALQDRALQYQNLQPPTSIGSFSLLDVKGAVARQQGAATRAKEKLGQTQTSTTRPIRFEVAGVDAQALADGKEYRFTITPDAHVLLASAHETGGPTGDWTDPRPSTLRGYATVRMKSAVASIKGLPAGGDGEYRVKLEFLGNPFSDRDLDGNPRFFRTVPRSRVYEYFFKDHEPKFSDHGESWSEGVSRVTPFSTWAISLPKLAPEQAAKLAGRMVTIRLTFVFEARVLPDRTFLARGEGGVQSVGVLAGAGPQKEALIASMARQGSVTNGWDVVFNMALDQINKSLAEQYEQIKANASYANRIKIEARTQERTTRCHIVQFEAEYGRPRLEFLANNTSAVKLTAQILKGSVRQCDFIGKCEDAKEGGLDCDDPRTLAGETLTATVPVHLLEGKVAPQQPGSKAYSVVVDLAKGAFDASTMQLSDEMQLEFNRALKSYFVNNPVQFVLNTLDLSQIATVEDLQPYQFRFKNLETPGGQKVLQLFINTGRRAALPDSQMFLNNTPEPLPLGYDCSLIISSRVFFGGVLPASASGWTLRGDDPKGSSKAWTATYTGGQLRGTVDFSAANFNVDHSVPDSMDSCVWEYAFNKRQSIDWPVTGMILKPDGDGILRMSFESKGDLGVPATVRERCTLSGSAPKNPETFKTAITLSASARLPTTVSGQGRDQTLKFDVTEKTFPVSGHMSGGGPFGCDNLQAIMNRQIAEQFPSQLVNQHNISFRSLSLFALKNLLFPSNNYIALGDAYVPGDLLILGNFRQGS